MKTAIITAVLLMTTAAAAAEKETFFVLGVGARSCGAWTQARRNSSSAAASVYEGWVAGWISGYNQLANVGGDATHDTDMDGVFGEIDNRCAAKPTEQIVDTVGAVTQDLIATQLAKGDAKYHATIDKLLNDTGKK